MKSFFIELAKKSKSLRTIFKSLLNSMRTIRYKLNGIGKKVDDKTIMFCSFDGTKYVDSPKALYEYILTDDEYKDYKLVWVFQDKEKFRFLEKNKNTIVIKRHSKDYEYYLHVAKYWIFNYKILDYIVPKKNQVFVQCWHGTPLKRLGCDLQNYDSALNTVEEMKKRYKEEASKFSYFISPTKYATGTFVSAWNLKAIGKENIIIEEGYPRNDFLCKFTKKDVERVKKELKLPKDKKVILYAPTYRANQHTSGLGYTYKTEVDFDRLQKEIGDEYIILFRAHYFVANSFDFKKYKGFIYDVSNYNEINDLYIVSDILITDYSSVFFDYSILKRPMIFYMYDIDHYKNESNGFYFDPEDELPGPIIRDEKDLAKAILATKKFKYDEKYKKFNEKFTYKDDGEASKRVIKIVIKEEKK